MDLFDALLEVLQHEGRPMKPRELSDAILSQGLWTSEGKTPWATVEARLATDIKKRADSSRFLRVAPGTYYLNPAVDLSRRPNQTEGQQSPAPRPLSNDQRLSFTDAAERVLREECDGKPMHYREISERALRAGLLNTAGKTPEATLYAQIYQENERRGKRGLAPRFLRLGKGMIGLAERRPGGLSFEIEKHNNEVKQQLLATVRKLTPTAFEALTGMLLTQMGFQDVEVTHISGDGGIDARAVLVVGEAIRVRMAIQAKRWKANVQSPVIQQVRGSLGAHERGLIITTSDYSAGARLEAGRTDAAPVALMSGREFVDLLVEYRLGVDPQRHEVLNLVALPSAGLGIEPEDSMHSE